MGFEFKKLSKTTIDGDKVHVCSRENTDEVYIFYYIKSKDEPYLINCKMSEEDFDIQSVSDTYQCSVCEKSKQNEYIFIQMGQVADQSQEHGKIIFDHILKDCICKDCCIQLLIMKEKLVDSFSDSIATEML